MHLPAVLGQVRSRSCSRTGLGPATGGQGFGFISAVLLVILREQPDIPGYIGAQAQPPAGSAQNEEFQNEFNEKLAADPLLRQVNETLATDGFFRQSVNANPTSGDNGTFAMTYQNGTGEQVDIQGAMSGGIVPSVVEQSFAAINVTAPLSANATYQSFSNELASTGFQRNQTFMNVSLSGATVNITYLSGEGIPAYVHATINQENVTQVSLGMETATANYFIPGLIAAIIAILAVCAWLIYRRLKAQKRWCRRSCVRHVPAPEPLNHRKEALRLLPKQKRPLPVRNTRKRADGLAGRRPSPSKNDPDSALWHRHTFGQTDEPQRLPRGRDRLPARPPPSMVMPQVTVGNRLWSAAA